MCVLDTVSVLAIAQPMHACTWHSNTPEPSSHSRKRSFVSLQFYIYAEMPSPLFSFHPLKLPLLLHPTLHGHLPPRFHNALTTEAAFASPARSRSNVPPMPSPPSHRRRPTCSPLLSRLADARAALRAGLHPHLHAVVAVRRLPEGSCHAVPSRPALLRLHAHMTRPLLSELTITPAILTLWVLITSLMALPTMLQHVPVLKPQFARV